MYIDYYLNPDVGPPIFKEGFQLCTVTERPSSITIFGRESPPRLRERERESVDTERGRDWERQREGERLRETERGNDQNFHIHRT